MTEQDNLNKGVVRVYTSVSSKGLDTYMRQDGGTLKRKDERVVNVEHSTEARAYFGFGRWFRSIIVPRERVAKTSQKQGESP